MSNTNDPKIQPGADESESFRDLLSQYERSHARHPDESSRQVEGVVAAVTADSVLFDIGFKTEGILPLSALAGQTVRPGDKMAVTVKGRNAEGYYDLSRFKVKIPTDWPALERAFAEKAAVAGTVTGLIKGGFNVDVGVRAFMPISRSGVRDAADLEKLVGQEIRCRIIQLDVTEEVVVVDRRVIGEEEERATRQRRFEEIREGRTMSGVVRSLAPYGAFIDLGGVDGLLHVSDIAWGRVNKPDDVLTLGQQVEAVVLKVDAEKRRISLGLKQLQPHPWDQAGEKFKAGERVRGAVTRLAEFGAFVELDPGIEGLIHLSEMSWSKKARKPSDVVKPGDTVEAVILGVNVGERRISLGLRQALGDPWAEVPQRFAVGSTVEGPVTSLMKFGAFVQLAEGIEGMIHISDISAEKRLNHPQEALRVGQMVRAQVLQIDLEKRQLRLGMKQLAPTGLDEYIAGHKEGDVVTGRIMNVSGGGPASDEARVELGEGVQGVCR